MAEAGTLAGVHVLVTRPAHQAGNLVRLIEAEGGEVIRFPAIEIRDPDDSRPLHAIIDRLGEFDIVIFVSPNAVDKAMGLIRGRHALPARLTLCAVGRGSANALRHHGIAEVLTPAGRFDSEGLLAMPELQAVHGKRIVIFRGEGGRELLGDTLAERGASVEYAECYRRAKPANVDPTTLLRRWARGDVHIVVVTSAEGLDNLGDLVGEAGRAWLRSTPVVVVGERVAAACRALGINQTLIAAQASDTAIVETIKAWRQAQNSL